MPNQNQSGSEGYSDRETVIKLAASMEHLTNEVIGLRADMRGFRHQMDGDNEKDGMKTRLALVEQNAKETKDSLKWAYRGLAAEALAIVSAGIVWLMTHLAK